MPDRAEIVEVTADLKRLSDEHGLLTERIWHDMLRVAAIEHRQTVLLDRMNELRVAEDA